MTDEFKIGDVVLPAEEPEDIPPWKATFGRVLTITEDMYYNRDTREWDFVKKYEVLWQDQVTDSRRATQLRPLA